VTTEEFWPYYLAQHLNPVNRKLHFAGTTFALACLILGMTTGGAAFLLLGVVGAYGLAWIGHFFFEKNAPATFRYPGLSLRADFKMYALMWRGKLDAEIAGFGPKLSALRK
jgi:hypothetical protein